MGGGKGSDTILSILGQSVFYLYKEKVIRSLAVEIALTTPFSAYIDVLY